MPLRNITTHLSASLALKWDSLVQRIQNDDRIIIAFSGGTDSTFLSYITTRLKDSSKVCVLSLRSPLQPQKVQNQIHTLATQLDLPLSILDSKILDDSTFIENNPMRCYHCKRYLYTSIQHYAKRAGYTTIYDGTNMSDDAEYRPGLRALEELGIHTPLKDAGLTKPEIRILAKVLELPNAHAPATTCCATRIAYWQPITMDLLQKIERLEQPFLEEGIEPVRVRIHGKLVRLELPSNRIATIIGTPFLSHWREQVEAEGFHYVCLDLKGYQSGSMDGEHTKLEH